MNPLQSFPVLPFPVLSCLSWSIRALCQRVARIAWTDTNWLLSNKANAHDFRLLLPARAMSFHVLARAMSLKINRKAKGETPEGRNSEGCVA